MLVSYLGVFLLPGCVPVVVNDPGYLSQDCDRHKKKNRQSASIVVKFRKRTSRTVQDFAEGDCVYLVAAKAVQEYKEFYVDYESDFSFDQ